MTAPSASAAAGIVRPVSVRIELPPRTVLINANEALNFHRKAERVKAIRNTAWGIARSMKVPAYERLHVYFVIHPDTKGRRRDPGNWAPSAKAAVDGLVDAGVLPDDNHTRLLGPDPRIGHPVPGSQLVLVLTDLDAISPAHLALLNPPGAES